MIPVTPRTRPPGGKEETLRIINTLALLGLALWASPAFAQAGPPVQPTPKEWFYLFIGYLVAGIFVAYGYSRLSGLQQLLAFCFFPAHIIGLFFLSPIISGAQTMGKDEGVQWLGGWVIKIVLGIGALWLLLYLHAKGR